MGFEEDIADLHKRLDELEKRLAEKEAMLAENGVVPSHHRKRIEEISAQAKASREKLLKSEESDWSAMKHEFERDWGALSASFARWVEHVDREFERQGQ